MFSLKTYKPLSRLTAVLALAILCAQTIVVAHEHHASEPELCAVCSTSAELADAPATVLADLPALRPVRTVVERFQAPRTAPTRSNHARAPPTA